MADKIAGVPKKVVVIGGAVAVGVLAYAYWRQGTGTAAVVPAEGDYSGESDYESPLGNTGTNSSGAFPGNVDPEAINTNAQWTAAAVEALQSAGWEASAVYSALGKLLAFKTLSAAEVQIVMAAKAAAGEPPQGGPYPIKEALPTPTPAPPPAPAAGSKRGYGWYKIVKGDNIDTVARKYGKTKAEIIFWNGPEAFRVGEWVKVRGASNPLFAYNGV